MNALLTAEAICPCTPNMIVRQDVHVRLVTIRIQKGYEGIAEATVTIRSDGMHAGIQHLVPRQYKSAVE